MAGEVVVLRLGGLHMPGHRVCSTVEPQHIVHTLHHACKSGRIIVVPQRLSSLWTVCVLWETCMHNNCPRCTSGQAEDETRTHLVFECEAYNTIWLLTLSLAPFPLAETGLRRWKGITLSQHLYCAKRARKSASDEPLTPMVGSVVTPISDLCWFGLE